MDWHWHDLPWNSPRALLAYVPCPLKGEAVWQLPSCLLQDNPCIWQTAPEPSFFLCWRAGQQVCSRVKKHCSDTSVPAVWGVHHAVRRSLARWWRSGNKHYAWNRTGIYEEDPASLGPAPSQQMGTCASIQVDVGRVPVLGCLNGHLLWIYMPVIEGQHCSKSQSLHSCRRATSWILDSKSLIYTCLKDIYIARVIQRDLSMWESGLNMCF